MWALCLGGACAGPGARTFLAHQMEGGREVVLWAVWALGLGAPCAGPAAEAFPAHEGAGVKNQERARPVRTLDRGASYPGSGQKFPDTPDDNPADPQEQRPQLGPFNCKPNPPGHGTRMAVSLRSPRRRCDRIRPQQFPGLPSTP